MFERLGVDPAEADLTVVQFSTAFCAPCRATKARLQQLQTSRPGPRRVHVDAESHLDEVRELDVRRTPTLFYLGRDGELIGRSSGAPRADELTALVDAHVGAGRVIGYSRGVGTLLTSRRTVDLCRVDSCLCPTS